ncbi:MAG: 1-acyl-sn-glycerol-3-phosphate acyltransferase [Chloroflexota bacterium]
MNAQAPTIHALSEMLIHELARAMARPHSQALKNILRRLFGGTVRRFSGLALELDQVVAEGGLSAGARWALPRFVKTNEARGADAIPPAGPLVLAANHPGAYDSLVISAHVARPDYKVIIGNIPFFQALPNLRARALFAPAVEDAAGRMKTIRAAIRHLQEGGALLIFARGDIEADPSFMPEPGAEFHLWSRSLEVLLRSVPQTRVLLTIVSGVIARAAFRSPLTWLRKRRADKQRLAFMYQMLRQTIAERETFGLTPRVTFGEIVAGKHDGQVMQEIKGAAERSLQSHLAWQARLPRL